MLILTPTEMLRMLGQGSPKTYPAGARGAAAALVGMGWITVKDLPRSKRGAVTEDPGFIAEITPKGMERLKAIEP